MILDMEIVLQVVITAGSSDYSRIKLYGYT